MVTKVKSLIDVKAMREKMGLSQSVFAQTFNIPVACIRHWEQNTRKPTGGSLGYLQLIEAEPEAMLLFARKHIRKE